MRDYVVGPGDPSWEPALDDTELPALYRKATIERVADPRTRHWTAGLINDPAWMRQGQGFFLNGPFASGKSSVAALLLMDACRRAEGCLWLPVRNVPRVRFREDSHAARTDDRLESADVVVLDDLGAESFRLDGPAGGALEAVMRVVYDRERSLIVTSNLTWTDVQARYPAAIFSMLSRLTTQVTVRGKS